MALPEVVRDLLVSPLLRIFLFLDALPQLGVWLGAVGLFVLLVWRGMRAAAPPRGAPPPAPRERGPAEELQALLRRARYSPWARRAVRTRLARVAVALRCEREKIRPAEAWAQLHQGVWPRDPRLRAFLQGTDPTKFPEALAEAVAALERYAQGGEG